MGAWSNTFLITQDLIPTAPPPPLKPWDLY
jgi:hypothetical protein